jgi:murein DD-endopeptidase MepM/ murein hydrolase activator NlpD
MKKAKSNKEPKYLSLILVPHYSGKIRTLKISRLYIKAACLAMIVMALLTTSVIYINKLTDTKNRLELALAQLNKLTLEQITILEQSAEEIAVLKDSKNAFDDKAKEFTNKYSDMIDTYVASRLSTSKANRSSDSTSASFGEDIKQLQELLATITELNSSETNQFASSSSAELQLKSYLDSMPTLYPADGEISSDFGNRFHPIDKVFKHHDGVDIAASYGSDIRAAAKGEVIFSEYYGGYGNTVIIDHGYGLKTLYGHASELIAKKGQMVAKGEVIANVGSTGKSTGSHLHFEIRLSDLPVDPLLYLDKNTYYAGYPEDEKDEPDDESDDSYDNDNDNSLIYESVNG